MTQQDKFDPHPSVIMYEESSSDLSPRGPVPLQVTPEYIATTKQSLFLLQGMVKDVLVDGRDYGSAPGIPGKFLFDPGASQIVGAFNCFPGHRRIISLVDDGEKIAVVIEVPLIQRGTGQEVGSGIGAASTLEVKHKYRWVTNYKEWGFDDEAVKTLKTRKKDSGQVEYRIPNPEHDELLNTITKQASKRAEVDAAEALPGVASVLRELFHPQKGKPGAPGAAEIDEAGPRWTRFWAAIRPMFKEGTDYQAETHKILGVSSMKDWLKKGKTLDDAIKKIAELRQQSKAPAKRRDPATVTEKELDSAAALERVMKECFNWDPRHVWAEANYPGADYFDDINLETAWQIFQKLAPLAKSLEAPPEHS